MTGPALIGEFLASLGLVSVSGYVLTGQVERLGARLDFTPGLLGLVIALGADSPEIASAVSAMIHGRAEVGAGVVFGSNIFNLAGLLGAGAIVAKTGLRVGRAALYLMGGSALLITLLAVALALGGLGASVALVLFGVVLVPYVVLSSLHEAQLGRAPLPPSVRAFLREALVQVEQDVHPDKTPKPGRLLDALSVVPTLAAIIAGSVVMVDRSITMGDLWRIPGVLVGTLILATLKGIPNFVAAIHLARRGRGTAVMSEALNSNSFNVIFGLGLPGLLLGAAAPKTVGLIAVVWLPVVTFVALFLASRPGGLGRKGGLALVILYAVVRAGGRRGQRVMQLPRPRAHRCLD